MFSPILPYSEILVIVIALFVGSWFLMPEYSKTKMQGRQEKFYTDLRNKHSTNNDIIDVIIKVGREVSGFDKEQRRKLLNVKYAYWGGWSLIAMAVIGLICKWETGRYAMWNFVGLELLITNFILIPIVPPTGFEPVSSAPKADVFGQTGRGGHRIRLIRSRLRALHLSVRDI